jgi:TB2/DP1, HVA22 family
MSHSLLIRLLLLLTYLLTPPPPILSPISLPIWPTTDAFNKVEEATGYPAAWFFLVACIVVVGVLTLVGGAKLLVDLVGFVYPAYMSFKSMDTNAGDDTQWLTYWICFSAMSITETMLSFITAMIPMYFYLKIAIIVVRCGCACICVCVL